MKSKQEQFYKLARPDGWDFYTGETINYRSSIGKTVRRKSFGKVEICSETCLHASRNPNQAFIGARVPCSVFLVEGLPVVEHKDKAGFRQLYVIKELDPVKVFKWRYAEACSPINPLLLSHPQKITNEHIQLLRNWYAVWDAVRYEVEDAVWDAVRYAVWHAVRHAVEDAVRYEVEDAVRYAVWDAVRYAVWDAVGHAVEDAVEAYIGYIFQPCVHEWEKQYPYQSLIDLWMQGLVPSFDGKIWRLHGNRNAEILWEGKI